MINPAFVGFVLRVVFDSGLVRRKMPIMKTNLLSKNTLSFSALFILVGFNRHAQLPFKPVGADSSMMRMKAMRMRKSFLRGVRLSVALILCLDGAIVLHDAKAETTNATAAILQQPRFGEGLTWIGANEPSEVESRRLLDTLNNLNQPSWREEVEGFLRDNPNSPWAASLHHAYASFCRRTGRTTKALQHWEEAWALLKQDNSENGKRVGGAVLASWPELLSSLGRLQRLSEIISDGERW